ncbi:MAG TPA: bifunctional UDP-sugar hydrolase/5'-nucleotidase [Bdellovibrionota bacterium]|jgi:5'-nucleotidase
MRHLVFLSLLLLASCSSSPSTVTAPWNLGGDAEHDQLVIVGTNDFHGYLRSVESDLGGSTVKIGGAEWFAGYADILQRKYGDRLILLDGGDMFQGTIDSNMFHGQSVVDFFNLLPYRAVAVGNHEFDYGPEKRGGKDLLGALKARMRQAKAPFVAANIFYKKSSKIWREKNLYPSVLVKAGDYKVGIIGLTTTSAPGKTLPKNVEHLEFRDFEAPVLVEAFKLRKQGADLVLITTHEGDGSSKDDPIYKLLHALPKGTVDAVVSGHTHSEMHDFVNGVPVIQSKTRGIYFGRIDLFVDKHSRKVDAEKTKIHDMHWICGTWFKNSEDCDQKVANDKIAAGKAQKSEYLPLRTPTYEGEEVKPSEAVRKVLAPYLAKADERRKEVVGEAKADFDWYPSGENQMGTLLLDAFHDRFPEAKVIYMNGGGIRRRLFKGPITFGDIYEVLPFDNHAVLVKVTGKQMKDLVRPLVSGLYHVPALWGIKVSYFNRDDSAFDRDLNGDGKKEKWERDRLDPVRGLVWEDTGKPVRDDEEFWIATIDYLVEGGDNTGRVFKQVPASKRKYFEAVPHDIVSEYLKKHRGIDLPRTDKMRIIAVQGEPGASPHQH